MVNTLSEDEILEFLMTSDFNEGLNLDELKFLLKKFRNYYRISSCNLTNYKDRADQAKEESLSTKKECENKILEYQIKYNEMQSKYERLINKKLSWKERLSGKIFEQT
jgi:hypothetical protein